MMNRDLSAAAAFELYQVGLIELAELDQLVTETVEVSGYQTYNYVAAFVDIDGARRDFFQSFDRYQRPIH